MEKDQAQLAYNRHTDWRILSLMVTISLDYCL